MKIVLTLATMTLLGTGLTGCSGDGSESADSASSSYCKAVAAAKPTFDSLSSGDLADLEEGFTAFHELADQAPGSLADQWKTLDDAATSVEESIENAGLTFDDLPAVQSGQIPPGVDLAKIAAFVGDLQKLNNARFAEARTEISRQAKDVCGVDLGVS